MARVGSTQEGFEGLVTNEELPPLTVHSETLDQNDEIWNVGTNNTPFEELNMMDFVNAGLVEFQGILFLLIKSSHLLTQPRLRCCGVHCNVKQGRTGGVQENSVMKAGLS